jgi:hypothetical protein
MNQLLTLLSSSVNFDCLIRPELIFKKEEHIEDRIRCIDVITRTLFFFQEFEQKINYIYREDYKVLYLSALKLLSEINFVTSWRNVNTFRDMVQMGLGLQVKILFLLIGFTNKELQD